MVYALPIGLLTTIVLMAVLRPFAAPMGFMDQPGGRKGHDQPVPVIGGVAMLGGLVAGVCGTGACGFIGSLVLATGGLMVVVGALDDRFNLHPLVRILAHLAAALALVGGTGFSVTSFGDLLGFGPIGLGVLAWPFTVVACIALINALNMLDGLDGLAGGVSLVAFAALAYIAVGAGATNSVLVSLALCGAIFAFLIFNVPLQYNRRIRAFMGDAGSTMLGFVMAAVALILLQPAKANVPAVVVLWLAPIPIFELFATTARRLRAGTPPWRPDRGHFHHRLLDADFSVRSIFVLYIVSSAVMAAIGLAAWHAGVPEYVLFGGFVASFGAWMVCMRRAAYFRGQLPEYLRRERRELGRESPLG